jgi:hypothetical protein
MSEEATLTVTAVRYKTRDGGSGSSRYQYADPQPVYSGGGASAAAPPPSNVSPPGTVTAVGAVNIRVSPDHLEEAKSAAQNIADAIVDIKTQLDANPNAQYSYMGVIISAAELRAIIDNTQFIVDDSITYNNLGVGGAQIGHGGAPNVDRLNYHAFSGSEFNPTGYGATTYNGQGVRAMILHELAHLSPSVDQIRNQGLMYFRREGGSTLQYPNSVYAANDETLAHNMQNGIAAQLGIAVDRYELAVGNAGSFRPYREPEAISNSRNPRGGG